MQSVFIFIDDDFKEAEIDNLKPLQTSTLVECLQGTIIGIATLEENSTEVEEIYMGHGNYLQRVDQPIKKGLVAGFKWLSDELTGRLGSEVISNIINTTINALK